MNKALLILRKLCFYFWVSAVLLLVWHPGVRAGVSPEEVMVKKVEYTSQNLRDPFKSPFEMEKVPIKAPSVEEALSHLQVQGMVWGSKMPQAIINNVVLKIGQFIDGAEIIDIRKEGVYVLYEGNQYVLRPTIAVNK